jgi:hypothetical protein
LEEGRAGAVVVDTYAILAMAYGELEEGAERVMMQVRRGCFIVDV